MWVLILNINNKSFLTIIVYSEEKGKPVILIASFLSHSLSVVPLPFMFFTNSNLFSFSSDLDDLVSLKLAHVKKTSPGELSGKFTSMFQLNKKG